MARPLTLTRRHVAWHQLVGPSAHSLRATEGACAFHVHLEARCGRHTYQAIIRHHTVTVSLRTQTWPFTGWVPADWVTLGARLVAELRRQLPPEQPGNPPPV